MFFTDNIVTFDSLKSISTENPQYKKFYNWFLTVISGGLFSYMSHYSKNWCKDFCQKGSKAPKYCFLRTIKSLSTPWNQFRLKNPNTKSPIIDYWQYFWHISPICPIISNTDLGIFAKKGLRHQNIIFPGQYSHFRLPRINFDEKKPIQKVL